MKIALISDTHLMHLRYPIDVPEVDLLIHCGDALSKGTAQELQCFVEWFRALPAKRKIFVPGNHDVIFEKQGELAQGMLDKDITFLQDSQVEIEGLKIYGSPWQPEFFQWAFNLPRGLQLKKKWEAVPSGIDILITHGPPLGILDWSSYGNENVGCTDLRREMDRIQPKVHAFGHVHGGYGTCLQAGTLFINAATCDERYVPNHAPIVIEMEPGKDPVLLSRPGVRIPERSATPIRNVIRHLWQ